MGSPGRGTLLYKHSLSVFSKSGSLRLQPRGQPYNLTHWRLYVRDYSPFHLAFSALLLACISSFFYISSFFLISSFSSISSFYCTFNYLNFLVFNFTILVFLGTSSFTYTFPAILALQAFNTFLICLLLGIHVCISSLFFLHFYLIFTIIQYY